MHRLLLFSLFFISTSIILCSKEQDDHDERRFIEGIDEDLWEIQLERREAFPQPQPQPQPEPQPEPRRGGGGSKGGSRSRSSRYRSSRRSTFLFWGSSPVTKANGSVVVLVAVVVGVLHVSISS